MALEHAARSRRAFIGAAMGGGLAAAATLGRPPRVEAADGETMLVGGEYTASSVTKITNASNADTVIWGNGQGTDPPGAEPGVSGIGVRGTSRVLYGVLGESTFSSGVFGLSDQSVGVRGESEATDMPAILGQSHGASSGIFGIGESGPHPSAKPKTGVYGYAAAEAVSTGVWGSSSSGRGVVGDSVSGPGVYGSSASAVGVLGESSTSIAVQGNGSATDQPAMAGRSQGESTGVLGFSTIGSTAFPAAQPKTGVFGYAGQDSTSRGVFGESPAGHGIHGRSGSGFAGYFEGKVFTNKFVELKEMSNPAPPAANKARLFVRDDGSGLTQLCVCFSNGIVRVLATM